MAIIYHSLYRGRIKNLDSNITNRNEPKAMVPIIQYHTFKTYNIESY